MIKVDQLGNKVVLEARPKRIVSLVPSQSEFLWDLGLRKELVGITKFCIHPQIMYNTVSRVGGTKTPDLKKIKALHPDLIIGNKEENDKEAILELEKEFPVWMSDIATLDDAMGMMKNLGEILGRKKEAGEILSAVRKSLTLSENMFRPRTVAYFIWTEPYMLAGGSTFINAVLDHCGLKNVAADMDRYPEVTPEQLRELNPDFCFLSSEPYPFKARHKTELNNLLPETRTVLVDGEAFSWYGSRLRHLNSYLNRLKSELYA